MDILAGKKVLKNSAKLFVYLAKSAYWWIYIQFAPKQNMYVIDPEREIPFETGWLLPFKEMEFNGKLCPVPNMPEKYLEHYYGDWKQIPSYEQRKVHIQKLIIKE